MDIRELHIELDVSIQQLSSARKNALKVEEKDMLLNRSMFKTINGKLPSELVKSRLEGFEDNQVLYDDLQELKEHKTLTCYNSIGETGYSNEHVLRNTVFGILPANYYHLINSESYLEWSCNSITYPSTTTVSKDIYTLQFPDDVTVGVKYQTFTIKFGAAGTALIYAHYDNLLNTTQSKFLIINGVLDACQTSELGFNDGAGAYVKFDCYWERYDNIYKPNYFIFVKGDTTGTPVISNLILNFNGAGVTKTSTNLTYLYNYYNYTYTDKQYIPNRLVSSKSVREMNRDWYSKTSFDSPLTTLNKKRLYVYYDASFIVESLEIEYLRRPRLMNWRNYQNCEITSDKFQREMLEVSAQSALAYMNSPTYQTVLNENVKQ